MRKKVNRKKSKVSQLKTQINKFKKIIESKLGKINWSKVGRYSLLILIFAAAKGLLGPKAKVAALVLFKAYTAATVV